jgi:hypothetical protein
MTKDKKFWLTIWTIVGVVACCLILTVGGCCAYRSKKFVEGGYVEQVAPGSQGTVWVKPAQ